MGVCFGISAAGHHKQQQPPKLGWLLLLSELRRCVRAGACAARSYRRGKDWIQSDAVRGADRSARLVQVHLQPVGLAPGQSRLDPAVVVGPDRGHPIAVVGLVVERQHRGQERGEVDSAATSYANHRGCREAGEVVVVAAGELEPRRVRCHVGVEQDWLVALRSSSTTKGKFSVTTVVDTVVVQRPAQGAVVNVRCDAPHTTTTPVDGILHETRHP